MPKINPKTNKKIIIVSILSATMLAALVFVYQKSNQFQINSGAENANSSENYSLEILDNNIKETVDAPKLVIADGFSGNNIDGGNDNLEFSKSVGVIAKIGENFLGLEKKDILYFIGKKLEHKPETIRVPQDYKSIQLAIDNANPKDTIEVSAGEYRENIIMKERISVIGVNVSDEEKELSSEASELSSFSSLRQAVLDGGNSGNVVSFKNGITDKTVFSGFTIKNSGKNLSGILIKDSSPLIHDNVFIDNEYGIYIKGNSSPVIQKNVIQFSNKGIQIYNFEKRENQGGSIQENEANDKNEEKELSSEASELSSFSSLAKPIIIDNLIIDNKIGIDLYNSSALIDHNVISYNNHYKTYIGPTYGIHLGKSSAEIANNIITDSGICDLCSGIVADKESKSVIVSFNDIWNNKNDFVCFGECILEDNNLSEDPLFVDYINGDFRLSEDSALIGKGEDGKDIGVRW